MKAEESSVFCPCIKGEYCSIHSKKPLKAEDTMMTERQELIELINCLSDRQLTVELTGGEAAQLDIAKGRLGAMVMRELAEKNLKKQEVRKAKRKIDKKWKAQEDWGNEQLGLKREGHMKRGLSCPDGVDDLFSVDYTYTTQKLAFIEKELRDAEVHATQSRVPVVVIFREGQPRMDALVIVRFRQWKELHGK